MVTKPHYRDVRPEPPEVDESWWDAVMAEDEADFSLMHSRRANVKSQKSMPAENQEATGETIPVNWEKAQNLYSQDGVICLKVSGFNRGGLLVSGEGLQGFVPVSHLVKMTGQNNAEDQEIWLAAYVGQPLQLKVIECDPERGRVVFSERAALAEPGSRKTLMDHLHPGDCIRGTVTNITDFGVFVDLGGVEGLIHVSELSWGRVRHPTDIVELGQDVEVYVINMERERARVALSLKRLRPNPWETANERYFPGQVTEAVVTSIVPFGAFARLEEGLDGLIHISEITLDNPGVNLNDLIKDGQRLKVRVLHVDGAKQRLGLSLRLEE